MITQASLSRKSRYKVPFAGFPAELDFRTLPKSPCLIALATIVFLSMAINCVHGGTRRDDVPDSWHITEGAKAEYQSVGMCMNTWGTIRGSAVLVANNYVLTAAHVADTNNDLVIDGSFDFLSFSGGLHSKVWGAIVPDWQGRFVASAGKDIAIFRLSTLVLDDQPAEFYTDTDEIGQVGMIVGFGQSGTGTDGEAEEDDRGTKRAGENTWDTLGSTYNPGWSSDIMMADFDSPPLTPTAKHWLPGSRSPLDHEYLAASGDSGGGVFLSDGQGNQKLAGITSFVAAADGTYDSSYGDAMGAIRISSHLAWLTSQMAPEYTMTWTGGSGGFNTAASWETTYDSQTVNCVPGSLDSVVFDMAGTHAVTMPAADLDNVRMTVSDGAVTLDLQQQTYTLTGTGFAAPSLVVGEAASATPTLAILDGTLATQRAFLAPTVGDNADMTLTNSAWNAAGSVFIGGTDTAAGGTATLTVDANSSVDISGDLNIRTGGTLDSNGGTIAANQITIGGVLDLDGGGITADQVTVDGGTYIVQTSTESISHGGMNVIDGDVTLNLPGQTYALTDTGLVDPSLVLGESAGFNPTLEILDGTLSTQSAFLGAVAGSDTEMRLTGGDWDATGFVYLGGTDAGPGGTALLTIDAGSELEIVGDISIWDGGTLDMAGGTLIAENIILDGGALSGYGTVYGNLSMLAGSISPGGIEILPLELLTVPEPSSLTALLTAAAFFIFRLGRGRRKTSA